MYRDFGPVVHRRARHILGSEEEARDAMQEVFVRILVTQESFGGDGAMLRWIYRVTTNLCLNRLRKRRTHPVVSDPDAVDRLANRDNPDDRRAVLQILHRMDALTQQIAVYHYVDGMKMEEIGELVGYSRKTVGKKLADFRKKAKRLLGDAP